MSIEPFDQNNIDAVEKMVTAVWGHPDKRPEYDHAFCGHLTRYSYYDPELSFQIADKDGIQGVCWAYVPGESNDADAWLEKVATILTDDERNGAYANVEYLKSTDALIGKLLGPKDVKLSFFIARKKGCGSLLLEHMERVLAQRGYKNLFLWTDTSCNWQFYPKHGFEMVYSEKNELYSTPEKDYRVMFFRKPIR